MDAGVLDSAHSPPDGSGPRLRPRVPWRGAGLIVATVALLTLPALLMLQAGKDPLEERIAFAVELARDDRGPNTVEIARHTEFEWDRFYPIGPRTPIQEIDRRLGFRWGPAAISGIDTRDDVCLLLFVRDRRVVRAVTMSRDRGDFASVDRPAGFTPGEAVFAVDSHRVLGLPSS